MTPERKARVGMDVLLVAAGMHVCDVAQANIHPATALDIREFPLASGFGFVDYLLYFKGIACGIVEASKQGTILSGVEPQSSRYAEGLPTRLLQFIREPTGVAFTLFRPALLVPWLTCLLAKATSIAAQKTAGTFLARVQRVFLPLLRLEEQVRIVLDVDRHLPIVSEVQADTKPKRARVLRQATLAKAFPSQRKTGVSL